MSNGAYSHPSSSRMRDARQKHGGLLERDSLTCEKWTHIVYLRAAPSTNFTKPLGIAGLTCFIRQCFPQIFHTHNLSHCRGVTRFPISPGFSCLGGSKRFQPWHSEPFSELVPHHPNLTAWVVVQIASCSTIGALRRSR